MKQENVSFQELIASSLRISEASCNKGLSIYISSVDDVRCNNLISTNRHIRASTKSYVSVLPEGYSKCRKSKHHVEWMRSATGETYGKMTYIIIYLMGKDEK